MWLSPSCFGKSWRSSCWFCTAFTCCCCSPRGCETAVSVCFLPKGHVCERRYVFIHAHPECCWL
uniref:Secreted protein n=1 Tax=Brassica oleracea TaxID=3712 RepID=A0A3P6D3U5_BRAOL|nr:unnamed protein product [Brassica oleracea]